MDIVHQEKIGLNPLRGFFQSPTAETPAWILTLKTSNDAVLRKQVPFEGYKSEISYLTEF